MRHVISAIFETMEVQDFRVLIKHCFLMGKSIKDTIFWLQKCYSSSAPSEFMVRKWFAKFKMGDLSLKVGDITGRPKTAMTQENVTKMLKIVRSDRKIKLLEIANIVKIAEGSVFTIIHDYLGMKKLCARWVPRMLTPDQKQQRVDESERCLELLCHDRRDFFRRYVTMDETWIHYYNPESKQQSAQWVGPDERRPKRPKTHSSAGKVMASVFWDAQGILFIDYLENGRTINSEHYIQQLIRLKEEIAAKRPGMMRKKILFHQDNAPAHRSMATILNCPN